MANPLPSIAGLQIWPGPTGRLMVDFEYHPDTVDRIKTLAGRQWHKKGDSHPSYLQKDLSG